MPPLLPSPLISTSAEAAVDGAIVESAELDELRCPICFAIMLQPRMLPGCSSPSGLRHSFCGPCIVFWLQMQRDTGLPPTCPIDRRVLGPEEQPVIDETTERAVRRQRIHCPNRRLGCTESFGLGDSAAHLEECKFRTVQCPHCLKPFSADALGRHAARCFHGCVQCGASVPRADGYLHETSLCLARAHPPWWSRADAAAFCHWREATRSQLGWLVESACPVANWERASALLLDVVGDVAQWAGRSGAWCLGMAAEMRRRHWRGPWVALACRAAELEPASIEARLEAADALLASSRSSAALEYYVAAAGLLEEADGSIEAIVGQAAALEALGRPDEALPLWEEARSLPPSAAPSEASAKARWVVAASRARAALGELSGAEEALLGLLSRDDAPAAQAEYARVLELQYLAEVPLEGSSSRAVPMPLAGSCGRDKLASAHDAWQSVLKAEPRDATAALRLALVEEELGAMCSTPDEASALYSTALGRLDALLDASLDDPSLLVYTARALVSLEMCEGLLQPPLPIEPPRAAYQPPSSSDDSEGEDEGEGEGEAEAAESPSPCVLSSLLGVGRERPRLQRASTLLRTALALEPSDPSVAALLGIVLCWSGPLMPTLESLRHLQNCIEMLRSRMLATTQAPAAAAASASAEASFDAIDGSEEGSVSYDALVESLLGAGQEAETVAELCGLLRSMGAAEGGEGGDGGGGGEGSGGAGGEAAAGARITRAQWRCAVAAMASGGRPDGVSSGSAPGGPRRSVVGQGGCGLYCEGLDLLLLYLGSLGYAQQLLLKGERGEAQLVLRDLIAIAPSLLRATFASWGYARHYCLLEQLWLEAYAGMVCSCLRRGESVRLEGLAMASQLSSMLQGKVQFRRMRHQVADWALELAPRSARPLLMKGEATLDQPLSGQDEADAEPLLRRALDLHRAQLEVAFGRRDAEAAAVLREGIRWLPHEVDLYLTLGNILERTDAAGAVELYTSFPPPCAGAEPGFDHAVIANSCVRLLVEQHDFDSPHLVEMLVTVGKRLGLLNIEKHIQTLDLHNATAAIKEVYLRVLPDHIDQSAFFALKGWDYERGSPTKER